MDSIAYVEKLPDEVGSLHIYFNAAVPSTKGHDEYELFSLRLGGVSADEFLNSLLLREKQR